MSKELTEKWRNGTLPCGFYYFTNGKEIYPIHHQQVKGLTGAKGVGVVDKVPTYDQFSQMVKKVEELKSKLSCISEQLKEANDVIHLYFKNTQSVAYKSLGRNDGYYKRAFIHATAKEYLEKWGVK